MSVGRAVEIRLDFPDSFTNPVSIPVTERTIDIQLERRVWQRSFPHLLKQPLNSTEFPKAVDAAAA
jgi:hypothetical protein